MTTMIDIMHPGKGTIRTIEPVTGETTEVYVNVVDIDARHLSDMTLTVANTGTPNSLDYKVLTHNDYELGIGVEFAASTLTAGDADQIILVRHARVAVWIKRTDAAETDYQVDAIMGRT